MGKCTLCGSKATVNTQDNASRTIYNCQSCGVFVLSDLVAVEAARVGSELAAYFAARKLAGNVEIVLVSFEKAKKDKDYLQLTVEQILHYFPRSFSEKSDLVLKNLSSLSAYGGQEIKVEGLDMCPVFYTRKRAFDALSFVIQSMQKAELLDVNYYGSSFFPCGVIIAPKGWDRLEQIQNGRVKNDTALLHCGSKEDETSDTFRSAAQKSMRECGYRMEMSVAARPGGKIGYELFAQIKNSRFVVCDLTQGGHSAYYLLGMANALAKPHIVTCHSGALKHLEFHAGQANVLSWNNEEDLYLQIFNAVRALVD